MHQLGMVCLASTNGQREQGPGSSGLTKTATKAAALHIRCWDAFGRADDLLPLRCKESMELRRKEALQHAGLG